MPMVHPDILRSIPLFSLLDDQESSVLAQQLDERDYLAGEIIISAGEPGNSMYIVRTGKVELFIRDKNDERVSLAIIEGGDLFGELSLLDTEPRSASAMALEPTNALIIDRNDLEILVTAHPPAALDMMTMLGKRMRETNLLLGNRVARNVNEEIQPNSTIGQRLSDLLTSVAGDIRFVYFSVIWFGVWIVWNTNIIRGLTPFDPFPLIQTSTAQVPINKSTEE
jgi:CRP/FNR family transcriptional regulator, cyclic AMP receptor protein